MIKQDHIFIDVETSGLDPKVHEIIDIAAIRTDGEGNVISSYADKVRPTKAVDSETAAVNGYTEDEWSDAIPFKAAYDKLCTTILQGKTEKYVVVAYYGEFDRGFLLTECSRAGVPLLFDKRAWIDPAQLAWPLMLTGAITSRKLEALGSYYGVSLEGLHTAPGDARILGMVYWQMVKRYVFLLSAEQSVREAGAGMLGKVFEMFQS